MSTEITVTTQTPEELAATFAPLGEWKAAYWGSAGRRTPILGLGEDSDMVELMLSAIGNRNPGERVTLVFAETEVTLVFADDDQSPDPIEAVLRHQKRERDDRARFADYARRAAQPQPPTPKF